tara:strand:+ start:480 stop:674 length:195 start_codon:yes stop_codon:yes gene_type:complete
VAAGVYIHLEHRGQEGQEVEEQEALIQPQAQLGLRVQSIADQAAEAVRMGRAQEAEALVALVLS